VAYTREKPRLTRPVEELRRTIPGWGVDLDPNDRPSVPKEKFEDTGAHWDFPERQPERWPREKSTEHRFLTPVFGTAQPPSGLSGMLRAAAFKQSENDMRHWLMLLLADRVNVVEGLVDDLAHGHVPNLFKEMGGPAEWKYNRAGFYKKAAIAGGAVLLLMYLNGRRKRR